MIKKMTKANNQEPDDARSTAPVKAPARVAAFQTGLSAETRAAAFLIAKGYRILARRFRTPYGEIDIVAKRRNLIAFIEVKARGNLSPEAQDLLMRQVESRLVGVKGVDSMYVRSGGIVSNGGPGSAPNDTIGRIEVEFQKYEERKDTGLRGKDISEAIRARVTDLPGMQIEVREPESGVPIGKAIQVQLSSHDPAVLAPLADALAQLR